MSAERDQSRVVRSWLQAGVTELPDRVLDQVLDQLSATPQRRSPPWTARRVPIMNSTTARLGLAAAAVIVIALLGLTLVPGMNIGGHPRATPQPTPGAVVPLNGQAQLGGRYTLNVGMKPQVSVSVPSTWSASGDWVVIGPKDNDQPDGMAIRFFTVGNVVKNPNNLADGLIDPTVGPTASDLADSIATHPAWTASEPTDTSVAGFTGKHVQLTVPADASYQPGDDYAFYLFQDMGTGQIWATAPDQIHDIYAIDVGTERLVIDAYHYPGTSEDDIGAQQAVLATVQIATSP